MSNSVAKKTLITGARAASPSLYAIDGGRKYLNAAERMRALNALASLDHSRALFVMLLAWTGARVSEVLALSPASLQIERGIVSIVTLKRRRHSVREVPIPPELMAALAAHYDLAAAQTDPSCFDKRLWPWHRVTAWRFVKELMRTAGVMGAPAAPRGFRHGFGVGAVQAGIPLNLIQRWLGHANLSTTAIYTEASGPEEQIIAQRYWSATPTNDPALRLKPRPATG